MVLEELYISRELKKKKKKKINAEQEEQECESVRMGARWSSVKLRRREVPAALGFELNLREALRGSGVSRPIRAVPEGNLLAVGFGGDEGSHVEGRSDPADDVERAHNIKW